MKKPLLLGALLLGSYFTGNAQILSENFSEVPAGWSVVDYDGDGNNWGVYTGDADTDSWGLDGGFAGSESWDAGAQASIEADNFIISPGVEIPAGGAILTFLKGYTYYQTEDGPADRLTVYVITAEQESLEDVIATEPIFDEEFDTTTGENFTPAAETTTIDLSAYAGQTIGIAFRHRGNGQEFVFVDSISINVTAGTNDLLASQLSVFPNPATNVINVSNADNILVNGVQIVDVNGRTVKSVKFDGVAEAQVNVSDLANGIYIMTVSSDKGSMTKKIVKN